jgi:hypothetical protein
MRFSLKWLLAGTVYVAIAAAAFARPHWAYSEPLPPLIGLPKHVAWIDAHERQTKAKEPTRTREQRSTAREHSQR